nr:hypothetical protein CFP56_64701 [Quercus suber]
MNPGPIFDELVKQQVRGQGFRQLVSARVLVSSVEMPSILMGMSKAAVRESTNTRKVLITAVNGFYDQKSVRDSISDRVSYPFRNDVVARGSSRRLDELCLSIEGTATSTIFQLSSSIIASRVVPTPSSYSSYGSAVEE